jgi:hypothetical protein
MHGVLHDLHQPVTRSPTHMYAAIDPSRLLSPLRRGVHAGDGLEQRLLHGVRRVQPGRVFDRRWLWWRHTGAGGGIVHQVVWFGE